LDKSEVKVVGELLNVHMQVALEPRVQHFMDIQVIDILDAYGMLLSRDWSQSLNGYMATNLSHMWFPWRGIVNQIRVDREPQMAHLVIEYNAKK